MGTYHQILTPSIIRAHGPQVADRRLQHRVNVICRAAGISYLLTPFFHPFKQAQMCTFTVVTQHFEQFEACAAAAGATQRAAFCVCSFEAV